MSPPQVFPKQLLLQKLPKELDILCTHPMFGPNSGSGSWSGLNLQFEKVRVGEQPVRHARVDKFLKVRWQTGQDRLAAAGGVDARGRRDRPMWTRSLRWPPGLRVIHPAQSSRQFLLLLHTALRRVLTVYPSVDFTGG